ncbi:hypothetical protein OC846_000214 [Tilletia horrida]|uniref:Uncharacterized protein n=1 Tax=Tilletia horrida TaxID=155126 RepID=A0AAN6GYG1_9BASI|nr:hypothetical protein OC846_000214 [Tilletia horrida]
MTQQAYAQRLNGDTAWLFSLPYEKHGAPTHFNLVVDPWLNEAPQVDMSFAFSIQKRVCKAAASSLKEVDDLLANRESESQEKQQVDAVLLSHPFTDHAHPESLTDPGTRKDIPLLGTTDALSSVRKLPGLPFKDIYSIPVASEKTPPWDDASFHLAPIPASIRIVRLLAKEKFAAIRHGPAWMQLHGAVAIMWLRQGTSWDEHSDYGAILYSPHGITPLSVPSWLLRAEPRVLLHSLDRQVLPSWLAGPVALGFKNAVLMCQPGSFRPNLLLGTHDERKTAGGIVARLIRREPFDDSMQAQLSGTSSSLRVLEVGETIELK